MTEPYSVWTKRKLCLLSRGPTKSKEWHGGLICYCGAGGQNIPGWTGISVSKLSTTGQTPVRMMMVASVCCAHTGGKGAWKPTKTSWVHCRLWLKVPTTYPLITDWVHSKCSQIMCLTWNLWEHLCNIWNFPNDILKMFPPHAQWEHLKFV